MERSAVRLIQSPPRVLRSVATWAVTHQVLFWFAPARMARAASMLLASLPMMMGLKVSVADRSDATRVKRRVVTLR